MPRLSRWLAFALVATTGVGMAIWTWGTWPDPISDFGKEIYIAWQLGLGRRLYADVAYHLGPLSPYFNGLCFRIFGPSLAVIEWVNLGLTAAIAYLLFGLIDRIAGLLAATVGGIVFIVLFAFGHFTPIADFNFVCPYDHEHTHGILLGLIGLTAADRYNRGGRIWALGLAGLAVGLAFLTRAELFVAAAAGVGATIIAGSQISPSTGTPGEGGGEGSAAMGAGKMPLTLTLSGSTGRGKWGRVSMVFLASVLLPILIAWGLLASVLPAHMAWRGILGSWPIVFDRSVANNPFYRDSMGTLHVGQSLWRLVRWTVYWSILILVPLAAARLGKNRLFWMMAAFVWGIAAACVIGHFEDPAEAFAPLPVALVGCMVLAWKLKGSAQGAAVGAIVWALVLLGKIVLNARIYQYGFALAMPATVIVVTGGISWLPEMVRRRGGEGRYVAGSILGAMTAVIVAYLLLANHLMGFESHPVAEGKNQFWADPRGQMLNEMLLSLRQKARPGETLAVMPEGAMLNFLAQMPNPTPYWSFNPPYSFFAPGEGEAAGQAKILAALTAHPPDWIVLVSEDLSDFGTPFFGKDYGLDLYAFVQDHYHTQLSLGDAENGRNDFGMMLLRRNGYNGVEPTKGKQNDVVSSGR